MLQDHPVAAGERVSITGNAHGNVTCGPRTNPRQGAERVIAVATHPVFSSDNIKQRLDEAFIERVIVTDTIPIPGERLSNKVEIITVAELFSKAISRIHDGRSVSALF